MGTSNCSACCHIWNGRLVENGILISDWIDFMKSIVVIFALAYIFFGMENYSQADAALKIREGDGAYGTVILTVKEAVTKKEIGWIAWVRLVFWLDGLATVKAYFDLGGDGQRNRISLDLGY